MFRRLLLATLLSFSSVPFATAQDAAARKPNIVLILADDMGWADLGCQGSDFHQTPHIDGLAAEGVRFTQAYAMSVCSPSRATLLTGRHAARLHITIWAEGSLRGPLNRKLLQGDSLHDLPHTETTLAGHLHGAGYITALVGKWHLGDAGHFPETHGFDVNIGGTHWGAPQSFFWPYRGKGTFGDEFRYVPDLHFGKPGEYLTDRLTTEALRVIDQAEGKPFFLYLAHHSVHTPIEARPEDLERVKARNMPADARHRNPVYAAMVGNLDDNVGRVLAHLKERGLEDNTLVIFASDNGGYIGVDKRSGYDGPVTDNSPLRSGKGALYEGGIRVPLIIRWPGVSARGGVCGTPVILTDLFHTCMRAAGLSIPATAKDGVDLAPLIRDPRATLERKELFFHYPHYYATTTPAGAVRSGDWKLLEYFEDDHLELYNLADDPGEARDLAAVQPERARELQARLHEWRASVNASLPKPNPGWRKK